MPVDVQVVTKESPADAASPTPWLDSGDAVARQHSGRPLAPLAAQPLAPLAPLAAEETGGLFRKSLMTQKALLAAREDAGQHREVLSEFFSRAAPALSRLGAELPEATPRDPAALREQLAAVAEALEQALAAPADGPASSPRSTPRDEELVGQLRRLRDDLAESEAARTVLKRALQDSEVAREALRGAAAPPEASAVPLYRPVKTDAGDCLLAAALLRLRPGVERPASAEFTRVAPGEYLFGPRQVRLRCQVEKGRLMVTPLEALDGEKPVAMELREFLAAEVA